MWDPAPTRSPPPVSIKLCPMMDEGYDSPLLGRRVHHSNKLIHDVGVSPGAEIDVPVESKDEGSCQFKVDSVREHKDQPPLQTVKANSSTASTPLPIPEKCCTSVSTALKIERSRSPTYHDGFERCGAMRAPSASGSLGAAICPECELQHIIRTKLEAKQISLKEAELVISADRKARRLEQMLYNECDAPKHMIHTKEALTHRVAMGRCFVMNGKCFNATPGNSQSDCYGDVQSRASRLSSNSSDEDCVTPPDTGSDLQVDTCFDPTSEESSGDEDIGTGWVSVSICGVSRPLKPCYLPKADINCMFGGKVFLGGPKLPAAAVRQIKHRGVHGWRRPMHRVPW